MDEESKGAHIYWPDTKSITVERNTYFDNSSADHIEEEEAVNIINTNTDSPVHANPPVVADDQTSDALDTDDAGVSGKSL